MLIIFALIYASILSIIFANIRKFKKYTIYIYILTMIWSIASTVIIYLTPEILTNSIIDTVVRYTERGVLGTAFLIIVMFMGAINPRSKQVGRLVGIRGELSIIGFILCLPHFFVYIIEFINTIDKFAHMELLSLTIFFIYYILGVWALIISAPLFITSFKKRRKKMKAKNWKYLQSFAYIFYACIFTHIILSLIGKPDIENYIVRIVIYALIFFIYTVKRVLYGICKKRKIGARLAHIIILSVLIVISTVSIVYAKNFSERIIAEKRAEKIKLEKEKTEIEKRIKEEMAKQSEKDKLFNDGKYYSTVDSYNGEMKVTVTLKNDIIVSIDIDSNDDPEYLGLTDSMVNKIKLQQNTEVDTVSGATVSSVSIIKAVDNCLLQAEVK